jgi:hypothetical protein
VKKCECGAEVHIDNSEAVSIGIGASGSNSRIHACVCPGCKRIYWYGTGEPVLTAKGEISFLVEGRMAIKKGNADEFV